MKNSIWDRQPDESSQAYRAFTTYLHLGDDRSFKKVTEVLGKRPSYDHQCSEWSTKFNWQARIAAWESEQEQVKRKVAKKELADATRRHIQSVIGLQKRAVDKLVKMSEDELNPDQVLRYMETGIKLERLLRGEATENVKETHEGTVSIAKMTPKQVDEYLKQIFAEKKKDDDQTE